jgi:hypothetical protein
MSKPKLRFKGNIEGREAGVVAAITPPIDVPEVSERGRVCLFGGASMDFHFVRR